MSYDLYFYKKKDSALSNQDIRDYLTVNLTTPNDGALQWFFENNDTEVYFSFEETEKETDPESILIFESFDDYENTNFNFNLNYIRPDFFGVEAFLFVNKFITDLGLFVLDPQSTRDPDSPIKPITDELYLTWSAVNFGHSAHFFKESDLDYYPKDECNAIWHYNYKRVDLQNQLGDHYFVPKIFFFKTIATKKVITVCSWVQNLPIILPNVDYYLISKKYKSLFKTVEQRGLISSNTLFEKYSNYLDDFEIKDLKIIHPHSTTDTIKLFNNLKLDLNSHSFMERLRADKIINNKM